MTATGVDSRENEVDLEIADTRINASEASSGDCELSVALAERRADLMAGRFVKESVRRHMTRVTATE